MTTLQTCIWPFLLLKWLQSLHINYTYIIIVLTINLKFCDEYRMFTFLSKLTYLVYSLSHRCTATPSSIWTNCIMLIRKESLISFPCVPKGIKRTWLLRHIPVKENSFYIFTSSKCWLCAENKLLLTESSELNFND